MDFFHNFVTFLVLNDSLCFPRLRAGAFESESSGKRSVRNGMEHQARIVVVGTLVIYRLPSDVDYIMLRPGWYRGIYCPIIPVPLEYFGEENLYLMDFSYFTHENLAFEAFLEKF